VEEVAAGYIVARHTEEVTVAPLAEVEATHTEMVETHTVALGEYVAAVEKHNHYPRQHYRHQHWGPHKAPCHCRSGYLTFASHWQQFP
jgi:hypothetical protein